jgi:hypothetical protein
MLRTCTITPETSIASARMTRYANLNSMPGVKLNLSVQRSVRNVEKGSLADETRGQVFQRVTKSEIAPTRYRNKLNAYADFCLRKIFIPNSLFRLCRFCIIRLMKPLYKQLIHILHSFRQRRKTTKRLVARFCGEVIAVVFSNLAKENGYA